MDRAEILAYIPATVDQELLLRNEYLAADNQILRTATMDECGWLNGRCYLLHDGDAKYTESFRSILRASGVEPLRLLPRSPDLNAHAEGWVLSIKSESLAKLILSSAASLRHGIREYAEHSHAERNHRTKSNVLLFAKRGATVNRDGNIQWRERLGGLLKYYAAA